MDEVLGIRVMTQDVFDVFKAEPFRLQIESQLLTSDEVTYEYSAVQRLNHEITPVVTTIFVI